MPTSLNERRALRQARKIGNSTAASAPHLVLTLARLIGLDPPSAFVPNETHMEGRHATIADAVRIRRRDAFEPGRFQGLLKLDLKECLSWP